MSQYGIFPAIFMSFFSPNLYRDVAWRWYGKVFLYLFVLLTIASIITATYVQLMVRDLYPNFSQTYVSQIPVLTYTDGKLSTPENRPYEVVNPTTKEPIVVIDATGQTTSLDQTKADVLITQSDVITRSGSSGGAGRVTHVSEKLNLTIDPAVWNAVIIKYLWVLWFIIFFGTLLMTYAYHVIQAFFYAIFGKIFAVVCVATLNYWQIVQIAMVAITPSIIINIIISMAGLTFPHPNVAYFLLSIFYIFFGVAANRNEPPLPVVT